MQREHCFLTLLAQVMFVKHLEHLGQEESSRGHSSAAGTLGASCLANWSERETSVLWVIQSSCFPCKEFPSLHNPFPASLGPEQGYKSIPLWRGEHILRLQVATSSSFSG